MAYREAGWLGVLPLPERRKAHPPSGWTGHRGAWPSAADVQTWLDGPEANGNVGLRLPRDVIGLDIDNYDGKTGGATFAEAVARWGSLPATWRSTNREDGQGSILFYRTPEGLAWPGELGPGVEIIQFAHRYAVVAPSVHPSGRSYRWVGPDGASGIPRANLLVPLPQPWIAGLTGGVIYGDAPYAGLEGGEVAEWLAKHGAGQPCLTMRRCLAEYPAERFDGSGSRHEAARDAVRRITALGAEGHLGMTVALGRVQTAFASSVQADPRRATDPGEWRRMLDGAVQIAAGGVVIERDPCALFSMPPPAGQGDDLLAGLRSGAWLAGQVFPPLRHAVDGLVPEGFTLLAGAPKIGKSFLVLDFALAKAAGSPALGVLGVQGGPVLYLALEDGDRRMQSRCFTLLGTRLIPEGFEYMLAVEPDRVLDVIAAWLARHGDSAPLVILDTLGKVMPPALAGESTYQRDYRIGSALKRLIESAPGASLVVNHHDRKMSATDFVDAVSGTHGLAGSADTTIVVARDRMQAEGLLRVTGRDVREGQYAVRFTEGTWRLDGADLDSAAQAATSRETTTGLGDQASGVVAFVNAHPEGVRAAEVAEHLEIDLATAKVYLSRAWNSGRLCKPSRGLYTPVTSVISVTSDGLTAGEGNTSNGSNRGIGRSGQPAAGNTSNRGNRGIEDTDGADPNKDLTAEAIQARLAAKAGEVCGICGTTDLLLYWDDVKQWRCRHHNPLTYRGDA